MDKVRLVSSMKVNFLIMLGIKLYGPISCDARQLRSFQSSNNLVYHSSGKKVTSTICGQLPRKTRLRS